MCGPTHHFPRGGYHIDDELLAEDYGSPRMSSLINRALLSLDFSKPSVQPVPATSADVVAMGLPAPAGLWLFDSATATHTDKVGAIDLTDDGNGIRAQPAIGIYDGSGMDTYKAYESDVSTTTTVESSETSFGNVGDSGSGNALAVAVLMRTKHNLANAFLVRKAATGITGWWGQFLGTSGYWQVDCRETSPASVAVEVQENHRDGAWHWVILKIDREADTLDAWSDLGAATQGNIASLGNLDNAEQFGIGGQVGIQAMQKYCQVACMIAWTGDGAKALDSTTPSKLMGIGKFPHQDVIDYTTKRTAVRACVVGNDGTTGEQVTFWGAEQFPSCWRQAFNDGQGGFGCQFAATWTNYVLWSEGLDSASWSSVTVSVTADAVNAPSGFKVGDRVTQTGVGGHRWQDVTGLTAETKYTLSFWARTEDGGHDCDVKVRNAADSADIASTTISVTDQWQRFTLHFTTEALQTNAPCRLYPGLTTDSAEAACFWGVQVNASGVEYAAPYIPTTSATASCDDEQWKIDNTGQRYLHHDRGEIRVIAVMDVVDCNIYDTTADQEFINYAPAGNHNARTMYIEGSADALWCLTYDDAGASQAGGLLNSAVADWTALHELRYAWDHDGSIRGDAPYAIHGIIDGVIDAQDASAWDVNDDDGEIHICWGLFTEWVNGAVQRIDIFEKPRLP